MADKILLKRADTPGKVPAAGDLTPGELAVNTADGKLYTKRDNGTVKEVGGGGGLTLFEESRNTTSPNATVPVHALTALGAETNIDFVIAPKGTGAILAQVPDGAAAGGNKRGVRAVDLQLNRFSSSAVSSGQDSFSAGSNCTASGAYSVAMGSGSKATGFQSVAFGGNNTASASYTVAVGDQATASQEGAVSLGGQANGLHSLATGKNSSARGVSGAVVEGYSAALGRQQMCRYPLRTDTSSSTAAQMTADAAAASSANLPVMPNNSAYCCRLRVVARNTSTNESMSWSGTALIKRGANAAATTLIGSSVTSDFGDVAMSACTVTLSADTTRGALAVTVTGLASTTVRWVAQLETVEAA